MPSIFPVAPPPHPLYVTAVICCSDRLPSAIVQLAHGSGIECIDVLIYNEEENYSTFLMSGSPEDSQVPLLFIFSEDDMILVDTYQELVKIEDRLSVQQHEHQRRAKGSLSFA